MILRVAAIQQHEYIYIGLAESAQRVEIVKLMEDDVQERHIARYLDEQASLEATLVELTSAIGVEEAAATAPDRALELEQMLVHELVHVLCAGRLLTRVSDRVVSMASIVSAKFD